MRVKHYQDMLEYVSDDTLIILDLSDMQKPYGRKLPDLKEVHGGSAGEIGLLPVGERASYLSQRCSEVDTWILSALGY